MPTLSQPYVTITPLPPRPPGPGKRPMHAVIAAIAMKEGRPRQVLGCMGADGQPEIHLQSYVGLVDFGFDIQQAIEMPRWLSGRFNIGDSRDLLNIEGRFPEATVKELERRGPTLNPWPDLCELARPPHTNTHSPRSGMRSGGAPP